MEMSPEEMIVTFRGRGFVCTELSDEHSFVLLKRGKPEKTGTALKNFADNLGFSFPQGHLYLRMDIAKPDPAHRRKNIDELKRWIELYAALDIRAAVLHPGGSDMPCDKSEIKRVKDARINSLQELSAFASGSPVSICLENLVKTHNCAEDLLEIIKDCGSPSNIGICLDTGHLNVAKGSQSGFIKKAGKRLKALHIADNLGENDDHMLPFGRGTVDWESVMCALKKIRYDGLFNFEVPGERKCPIEVRMAKLDYALALAKYMVTR
jgi:sugar phosphate isomerase/epimerase